MTNDVTKGINDFGASNKRESRRTLLANIYDSFAKSFFQRILMFVDFMLNYASPEFVELIDLSLIEIVQTHYFGKDGDERIADLVFRCPLRDGSGDATAIIIFEHISNSLSKIPLKLNKYTSAIWVAEDKAGKKFLSVPYCIVLRTGKNPFRGRKPKLADRMSRTKDGKTVANIQELDYDVVDVPALIIGELKGGTVLRTAMGVLKAVSQPVNMELSEALKPLEEIKDDEELGDYVSQLIQFITKVSAAYGKRMDKVELQQLLEPILKERTQTMILTVFDETFLEGKVEGKAEGKAEGRAEGKAEGRAEGKAEGKAEGIRENIIRALTFRIKEPPMTIQNEINSITNIEKLDELFELALACVSMNEFSSALK